MPCLPSDESVRCRDAEAPSTAQQTRPSSKQTRGAMLDAKLRVREAGVDEGLLNGELGSLDQMLGLGRTARS